MERLEIIALLREYVHGDSLLKHCLATGAIMRSVAGYLSGDQARWEEIGILQDIDFECVNGDMQQHGIMGARLLEAAGIPKEISRIVERHNHILYTGTYEDPVEIALQAADSTSGLVIACALVKGGRLADPGKDYYKESKGESLCCRVRPEPDRPYRAPCGDPGIL